MKIHKSMLNVFSKKDGESSKIEARENDIMNVIQAKMSKPMSEDDLFGHLLAEKLKKLPFELSLQAKNKTDNMMFKYSMMSHNSGKQPVQAHQFNVSLSINESTTSYPFNSDTKLHE